MAITPTSLPAVSNGQAGAIANINAAWDAIDDLTAVFNGWVSTDRAVKTGALVFNVKDYGALGNDSADDTAALAAAVTAAAATTSGGLAATVYLPPGTYRTTGITLPDNVQLRGAGQRASRLQGVGGVTTLTIGTSCVVSDLHIRGDSTAGGKGVAATATANHWSLVDCWVTGHENGVYLTDTYLATLTRTTVQTCTTGVRLTGSNVNAIFFMNGEIKGCVDGVYGDTGASTKVAFIGVTIEGNSGYGINNAGSPYGWSVRDSYFEANVLGHIYSSVQSRAWVISGVTFSGAAPFSISFDAGLDTLVEGCTFNTTTGGGTSMLFAAPVARTTLIRNWYNVTVGDFNRVTGYLGTALTQIDRSIALPPSTTSMASVNVPHGSAPTSPVNGDMWTTTAGLYVRVNGVTVGPFGAATPPNIQAFTAGGTYTKPAGATTVTPILIGGGGGGGSGRRDAAGTVRCGGGGGGGAGFTARTFDAADIGGTETVTVGAAGTAGAAVTADATNGNAGGAGTVSSFGAHASAGPGSAGAGGTTSTGTGGAAGTALAAGSAGGSASVTGGVGGGAGSAGGASGGGSGGGVTSGNAAANGGAGQYSRSYSTASTSAGVVDSTSPSAGTAPAAKGIPGPGGGGGAASITTTAQTGATPNGFGGGGGGGGASLNGNNSGAGGAGAPGYLLVVTTF